MACPCPAATPVCRQSTGYCYPSTSSAEEEATNPFVANANCNSCDGSFPSQGAQESADEVPCEGALCVPDPTDVSNPNMEDLQDNAANASSDGNATVAPKTFRLQMMNRRERTKSLKDMETTIAIAFITRGNLPLFENVWGAFFSGCNGRAAVPIVHTQGVGDLSKSEIRHELSKQVDKYGGTLVPEEKTVEGEMRFSFNMVAGMFALVRTASKHRAPNGKVPDWIHFASERCAPLRPCPSLQRFLDSTPKVNHLESSPSTSVGVQQIAQQNVPKEFRPLTMSSQWATLWMDDAMTLADDEDRLREKWGPRSHPAPIYGIGVSQSVFVYGAPDEWLWHTELGQLNKTRQSPGLTNVYWCWGCEHADNADGASPAAYLNEQSTTEGCTRGQNMGDFFGRKYGNGNPNVTPLVEKALLECRKQHVEKPSNSRDVEFSRLAKQYPRTRGEAMVQHGKAIWTNSSVSFTLHMQRAPAL